MPFAGWKPAFEPSVRLAGKAQTGRKGWFMKEKRYLIYDTVPYRANGAAKGFRLQLQPQPMRSERAVYREIVKELSLNLSEDTVAFIVEMALKTLADKVAEDGLPRRIGNFLKFTPILRGRVDGVNSPYDPKTVAPLVKVTALRGLARKLNEENLKFVNSRPESRILVTHIHSNPQKSKNFELDRGAKIVVYGRNILYRADLGDSIEVAWRNAAGEEEVCPLQPSATDYYVIEIPWPEALDRVPSGTPLAFTLTLRGGVENAAPRAKCVACTLK